MVNYTGVIGSRYTPQPDNLNLLGLEEGIQNAELELEGAGMTEDLEVPITVESNSITAATEASPSVSAVKAKIDKKTGIMTGSMRVSNGTKAGAKSVQFRAMLNSQGGGAVGHFTVRGAAKGVKAGSVQVVPKGK
jgi:hypothetical protein